MVSAFDLMASHVTNVVATCSSKTDLHVFQCLEHRSIAAIHIVVNFDVTI